MVPPGATPSVAAFLEATFSVLGSGLDFLLLAERLFDLAEPAMQGPASLPRLPDVCHGARDGRGADAAEVCPP
jgi:hypothetical protein